MYCKDETRIMSVNLLLEDESAPVIWRGPIIAGVVKQFWTDVMWGDIDYLFGRYAAGNRRRSFDSISVASGRRCGDRDISTGSCTDDREKSGEYGGTDEYSGTWDHRKLQLCKMP